MIQCEEVQRMNIFISDNGTSKGFSRFGVPLTAEIGWKVLIQCNNYSYKDLIQISSKNEYI